uniref:Cystatin B n=1 Tax=Sphenodon punctatus TaxID=8508 RepID=A0A8D0GJR0_SPHPU
MMTGGLSGTHPATPEIQRLVEKVKPQLEEKENKTYLLFKAIEYKTQVVAGTNYFIKVHCDTDEYVHLRVFQSLPHENQGPSLTSYQTGRTKDDSLNYF